MIQTKNCYLFVRFCFFYVTIINIIAIFANRKIR